MQVATLPEMAKPDTGGEETAWLVNHAEPTSSTRWACRGGWGWRVPKEQSRNLGDPSAWVEPNAEGKT